MTFVGIVLAIVFVVCLAAFVATPPEKAAKRLDEDSNTIKAMGAWVLMPAAIMVSAFLVIIIF